MPIIDKPFSLRQGTLASLIGLCIYTAPAHAADITLGCTIHADFSWVLPFIITGNTAYSDNGVGGPDRYTVEKTPTMFTLTETPETHAKHPEQGSNPITINRITGELYIPGLISAAYCAPTKPAF